MSKIPPPKGKGLSHRLALPMACVVALLVAASVIVSYAAQKQQSIETMREQAYILSQEMQAAWDFVGQNQYRINHDSEGKFDFKGLHCSVAGLAIGALFSDRTDYEISYASEAPRNGQNSADEFELGAIAEFEADPDMLERYAVVDTPEGEYFRYVIPLRMNASCADCHGGPAGEIDVTGYPKEGLERGELVGVASISVPTATYDEGIARAVATQCVMLVVMIAACAIAIYVLVERVVVGPLSRLAREIRAVDSGDELHEIDPDALSAKDEIRILVERFNEMAGRLAASYEGLENEVAARTADLARANEDLALAIQELQAAGEYKSHFIAMMSHELKTPLTSTMIYASMLEAAIPEDEEARVAIAGIRENNGMLLRTIDDILEMARIEAGTSSLNLQVVDVADLIHSVEAMIAPLAADKGVSLHVHASSDVPLLSVDPEKIHRVVGNLAGNAVKFTPSGGSILIESFHWCEDDTVRIRVVDKGVGIAAGDLPYIFDKFRQADSSSSRRYGGSGLGLTIAREFAVLHGGHIEVESVEGEGSTFTLVLDAGSMRVELGDGDFEREGPYGEDFGCR